MESLDVFVMPSFSEGTPNSIVEAMACGKPIIASEVGGIPDMIGEESGILVPPGDQRALTEAMLRLALDEGLRKRMGATAKERYEELFSPAVVVPLMLETYHRIRNKGIPSTLTANAHHPWANDPTST